MICRVQFLNGSDHKMVSQPYIVKHTSKVSVILCMYLKHTFPLAACETVPVRQKMKFIIGILLVYYYSRADHYVLFRSVVRPVSI